MREYAKMIEKFYRKGSNGLLHMNGLSIASWAGNCEFQISDSNFPLIACYIDGETAHLKLLSSDIANDEVKSVEDIIRSKHSNVVIS